MSSIRPTSEFVKMPDGSLVLTRKPVPEQAPGFFAGLARFIPERFRRKEAPVDQYWIPPAQSAAPAPAVVPTLPAYNAWNEIEGEVEREARIARELGEFSKRVMADERLVGKER